MTPRSTPAFPLFRGHRKVVPLALLLAAGGVGCYRATGESRPTTVAEQIPATGGDRVAGMKATGGPGDYYLGNDYIQMAVDGAAYGQAKGQFGAPSGGAVLDIGGVGLDTGFKRVSLPTDNVERLAPVVNQDPELPLVFDHYATTNTDSLVTLTMTGYLLDPSHKLAGASWDANGKVLGVTVTHLITLGSRDAFFTLDTTVTNGSAATLPIQSIGDYLHQRGGGFRFIVPANQDQAGSPLSTWGLDIPGTDFTQPLATSVRAPMVGLQGAEPSAQDLDSHQSLGILPLKADHVLVASDPQTTLGEPRPIFPSRLVVGSLPVVNLAANNSLEYQRRLYVSTGASVASLGLFTSASVTYPVESAYVTELMEFARASLGGTPVGPVIYSMQGTATERGYSASETRFERYTWNQPPAGDPTTDTDPTHWSLECLTAPEPGEIVPSYAPTHVAFLPAVPYTPGGTVYRPYRVVARNRAFSTTYTTLSTIPQGGALQTPGLLTPTPGTAQTVSLAFAPETAAFGSPVLGTLYSPAAVVRSIAARQDGDVNATTYVPSRYTLQGLDASGNPDATKDPSARRIRTMAGIFTPVTKSKILISTQPGAFMFSGGNEAFGSALLTGASYVPMAMPPGAYNLFVSRGPLLPVTTMRFTADKGTPAGVLVLTLRNPTQVQSWSTFDMAGPSEMTTGSMLPAEQLSSALANGVDVVARTEDDAFTDGAALATSFRSEFATSGDAVTDAARLAAIGSRPFVVNARSSSLAEGAFTTLFAPAPDGSTPFGGALPSEGWSAADFIGQGGGTYVVAHRPRGPLGVFTSHPVAAGVPLGTGANSWWSATDALANGRRTGDFDAVELLRGEGCNPADPSAWFAEFKNARTDWFNLLNLQTPAKFTKALGFSSGVYSLDTPVGLARTYLKLGSATPSQADLSAVQTALQSGAAVASTGPLVDAAIGGHGPGGFVSGTNASVTLTANLWFGTWVPVDEIRVVVNGTVAQTLHLSDFTQDTSDARHWTASITVPISALTGGKDGWVVVEAGVPLSTTGAYLPNSPWNKIMKGIYPVAVTNPIFVDVDGGGYTAPL